MPSDSLDNSNLILAAEDFGTSEFERFHRFSAGDERIIAKLMAHGPVLIRGGRGSGKSALMLEAERRLNSSQNQQADGIYVSLRHLELIRSSGTDYEVFLCRLLLNALGKKFDLTEEEVSSPTVADVQRVLGQICAKTAKRIILFFDDAAHIGREASLGEFFDVFRTISNSMVACKAAIYPGVTRFGNRFDIFNDATVLDLSRSDEIPGYGIFFAEIMSLRFSNELPDSLFQGSLSKESVAGFLGAAVLGNMRSFIFSCNTLSLSPKGETIGYPELTTTLITLASNYFWPLLEEVEPKLGPYAPMVATARQAGETLFEAGGKSEKRSVLILREIVERLSKPLEILEYAGFIAKREASRSMKSGGRGARYALNLCNLLEHMPGARLTKELHQKWTGDTNEPFAFHRSSKLQNIELPSQEGPDRPTILTLPIETLAKSKAYPYGLTVAKIQVLQEVGINTVGDLAAASDKTLLALDGVGDAMLLRMRNIVGQAIWM